ncbi:MAG: hypothetical protein AAF871_12715 [Pseudomonadota bacterium]
MLDAPPAVTLAEAEDDEMGFFEEVLATLVQILTLGLVDMRDDNDEAVSTAAVPDDDVSESLPFVEIPLDEAPVDDDDSDDDGFDIAV